MVRAEIEEHEIFIRSAALHAPFFRLEQQRFLLHVLLGNRQCKRIELGSTRRIFLAQRMALPGARQHDALQIRVTIEGDAEQIPDFALVPVGVLINANDAWSSDG